MTATLQLSPHFSVEIPPLSATDHAAAIAAVSYSIRAAAPHLRRWPETAQSGFKRPPNAPKPDPLYGVRPAHGSISSFPIFAALWCQPKSAAMEASGRAIQATLLAGCILLAEAQKLDLKFESAVRNAGLSTRHILTGNVSLQIFDRLCDAPDLQEVLHILTDAEDWLGDQDYARIRGLSGLIRYALFQDRTPPERRVGLFLRQVFQSTDRKLEDGSIDVTVMEESRHVRRSEGGAPFAEYAGRQLALVKLDDQASATRSRRQAYWRAAHQARAIRARNQGLVSDMDRLQLVDVLAVHQVCAYLVAQDDLGIDEDMLGLVALAISLLTGLHVAQFRALRFTLRATSDVATLTSQTCILLHARHLILPTPELENAYIPDPKDRPKYRQPHGYLLLLVPRNPLYELVSRFFEDETNAVTLLANARSVVMEAQAVCSDLNARHNTRLTIGRAARFLFDQARSLSGDWAEAAYFRYREQVDARHYYYCPEHWRLAHLYARIWRGVSRAAGMVGVYGGEEASAVPVPTYVGCAACPTLASVRMMVRAQVQTCRKAQIGRPGRLRTCRRHNALALYTWLMLTWMTGIRPVNVSIELASFDPATSMLFVSDKDTDAYCASRLVWIPRLGRRQIKNYLESVARLRQEFERDYPDDFFFVDRSGKRERLAMAVIRKGLKFYPFKLNAQRHFLRTELRERGATAQSVDALLGHGGNGHEPYARHSAFSAQQMVRELQEPLQDLIRSCGWVTLPGGRA